MGLNIQIIAPDGLIWDTAIQEVVLPSTTGQIGILEDHTQLITALEIGLLRIKVEQTWKPILVLGGFATIKNNNIIVLVSGVEEIVKGNYEKAQKILQEMTETLSQIHDVKEKIEGSQNLKLATARVQAYQFLI